MAQTGLLVVTNLKRIAFSLSAASKHVCRILYVQINLPGGDIPGSKDEGGIKKQSPPPPPSFSKEISAIYLSSLKWCNNLDVRVILSNLKLNSSCSNHQQQTKNINVILYDGNSTSSSILDKSDHQEYYKPDKVIHLNCISNDNDNAQQESSEASQLVTNYDNDEEVKMFDNVVLGGTFDRLHVGHKLLLTEAVLRAKKRLVVGVTDTNMIKSKKLYELILPVEQRINEVLNFLTSIDCTLKYEVVPIQDPFGPTQYDPNLDLIVVSAETMRGGEMVNEIRLKNSLSPLQIHCINLIESTDRDFDIKEAKISSSNQRLNLLGTRLREPKPDFSRLPPKPYIIGLTGGIAAGKSRMAIRLEKLGAQIIDCDKLAHKLYEPNELCYKQIIDTFGKTVVANDGSINRKILGEIVFSDPIKLEQLNNIVWPELLVKTKSEIVRRYKETQCNVLVIEAAILLKAGWQRDCHEIWSLIVSKNEAIRRLKERNQLTDEEAEKRIAAQEKNETIVKYSNIVFSSEYGDEFAQFQVQSAWKTLMDTLKQYGNKL